MLPIVIGVTGHRDLRAEDRPHLEQAVGHIFRELGEYRSTPLLLLSQLAEGADRLVAEVALAHSARLVVPLPMELAEYKQDFTRPGSIEEFERLLDQADDRLVAATSESLAASHSSEGRSLCYEEAGAYIAARCHLMIALWDGEEAEGTGGTARIVRMCRDGVPVHSILPEDPLDLPERREVRWVVTPRERRPETRKPAFTTIPWPAQPTAANQSAVGELQVFNRIESFNASQRRLDARLSTERARSRADLFTAEEAAQLTAGQRRLLDLFAGADTLATYYARRTKFTLIGLLALVFSSGVLYQLLQHWRATSHPTELLPLRVFYWVALIAAFAWYQGFRKLQHQQEYHDSRALAEGIRVQLFWLLAGIGESASEHYLRKQSGELEWIRMGLRSALVVAEAHDGLPRAASASAALRTTVPGRVIPNWVQHQRNYFAREAHRQKRRHEILSRVWHVFVGVGIAIGLIKGLAGLEWPAGVDWNKHPVMAVVILATTAVGLSKLYAKIMAYAEHSRQYARMGEVFDLAAGRLKRSIAEGDADRTARLLAALGRESLIEHADWLLLHRERPIELPKT